MWQAVNNLILFLLLSFSLVACNQKESSTNENTDVAPSSLSYNPNSFVLEKNTPLEVVSPMVSGTNLTFTVTPALPTGVSLNSRDGFLAGIPRAVALSSQYTITASNSKGSVSTKITLQVNDKILPSVSYPKNRYAFLLGSNIGTINPITSGATFVRYSIDPELPTGLNFNTNTGQITGTSQLINPNSYHSVNAYISDSLFVSTSISFELNDLPPVGFYYNPQAIILQKNTPMQPVSPISSGGAVTSYSVNPALPPGLNLNQTTGVISGTPTVVRPATVYQVVAKNSGGESATAITVQVKDIPPSNVSYGTSTIITTRTISFNQITPTYLGGAAESFSISPALPAGLNFNAVNGAISGTPSTVQSARPYTITATNSGGSSSSVLNITIKDLPPQNLSYPIMSEIFVKNTAIQTITPSSQGGSVSSYSITPNLPTGLSFDTASGAISGTPTVIMSATSYSVTARNSEGSSSYPFILAVKDEAPQNLTYPSLEIILEKGTAMTPLVPSNDAGSIKNYTAGQALPPGLLLEPTTGIIGGTPSMVVERAEYTINGSNPTGTTSRKIYITVNDKAPSNLTYGQNSITFSRGIEIPNLIPSNLGGTIEVYTIDPELPRGLILNNETGEISGTPLDFQSAKNYTITGTNTGGSIQATIEISINDYPPEMLSYASTGSIILRKNIAIANPGIIPIYSGGAIVSFKVDPLYPLPSGLVLNSSNGYLSGTPSAKNNSPQLVKIIGVNTGGQTVSNLQIRILDEPPVLTLANLIFVYQKGSAISQIKPTVSGGTPSSFLLSTLEGVLNPPLPPGLTFNQSTGTISGTPTSEFPETVYGITGLNEGGDSTVFFSIRITEVTPFNISYGSDNIQIERDQHNYATGDPTPYVPVLLTPTASGGPVTKWSISPALPTGLSFNENTGAISGIPIVGTGVVTYTVSASNSGGTGTKVFNLKIKDIPPTNLVYNKTFFEFESADDVFIPAPENSGGFITRYSISPALPSGLVFDTTTGEISKVSLLPFLNTTNFTITGSNDEGSTSTIISLKLNPSAPQDLKYLAPQGGPEGIIYFTIGDSSKSYTPTNKGGLIDGCVVNGVTYSPYRASEFAYLTEGPNFATNNRDLIPTTTASLPNGISFNTTTGAISGTPISPTQFKHQLRIDACNAGGSTLSYAFLIFNRKPVAVVTPTVTTTIQTLTTLSAVGSYDPDDDPRIIYDPDQSKNVKGTKVIAYDWKVVSKPSGSNIIDTSINNRTQASASFFPDKIGTYVFSVAAQDDLSSSSLSNVTVTVKDVPPSSLSYGAGDYGFDAFVYNVADSVSMLPTNNGGKIVSYTITPALPNGLNFNTATGLISGSPNSSSLAKNYTIEGCNTGGCTQVVLKIWVNAKPVASISGPSKSNYPGLISLDGSGSTDPDRSTAESLPFSLVPTQLTYQWTLKSKPTGSALSTSSFSNQNGATTTINPDKKGTYVFELVVYDGLIYSEVASKTIKVGTAPSGLTYGSSTFGENVFAYTKNKETISLTPSAGGDVPDSYSISPGLPSGLSFSTSTGVISGKATNANLPTNYTITASNNGGDSSVSITLWINEYPIADAGVDSINAIVGNQINLDGTASYDADFSVGGKNPFSLVIPTYLWELIGAPPNSLLNSNSILNKNTKLAKLTPDVEGIFVSKFSYYDYFVYNQNWASSKITTQNNPIEKRPIADAGQDIVAISQTGNLQLDAQNSQIFSGNISYNWEIINKPIDSLAEMSDPNIVNPEINFDLEGSYVLKLTVSDGTQTDSDFIAFYVDGFETSKGGIVSSDETWTKDQSPIVLTSNITINSGAKILVEPGVVIVGNGNSIFISNGSFEANGSNLEPVFINNLFLQRSPSGTAGFNLNFVEMIGGGLCTSNACNGQVVIKNSILKDLSGSAKIIDSTEIISIENSSLINTHGFEISTTGIAMNFKENFVYQPQGSGSEKFFLKVIKNQLNAIAINSNWFINLDNRKIILNTAPQDLNARRNFWQATNALLTSPNIQPSLNYTTNPILIEPFYTFPSDTVPSGKKYLP